MFNNLMDTNSQVAEQGNKMLGGLKPMLSFMTHERFMKHLSFYFFYLNSRKQWGKGSDRINWGTRIFLPPW